MKYYNSPPGDKRPQLSEAIGLIVERYQSGDSTTSIFIPPRVGKSTVIRGAAAELVCGIGAQFSLMLAPWKNLAQQINSEKSIKEEARRYAQGRIDRLRFTAHEVKKAISGSDFCTDGSGSFYTMTSLTMSRARSSKQQVIDAIRNSYEETGLRVPVFADESHLMKERKSFGDTLGDFVDVGAFVVTLTGTPWTTDGARLFGFKWKPDAEAREVTNTSMTDIRHDENGKKFATFTTSSFMKAEGRWSADYEVSYEDAFKSIKALNMISAVWVDPEVTNLSQEKAASKPLSEINFASENFTLRDVLQQKQVTVDAARETVSHLQSWRSELNGKKITALVVTGSDEANGDDFNKHARDIKNAIEGEAEASGISLVVEIATSIDESGEPDKRSAQKITDFREGRGADVLVVKMMGLVGLDADHLKVQAFLSPIRNGPLLAQALTRTCTLLEDSQKPSTLILPYDKEMKSALESLLGCGLADSSLSYDKKNISSEEREIEDVVEPPKDVIQAVGCSVLAGDLDGDVFEVDGVSAADTLYMIRFCCPDLALLTDPKLLRLYESGHIVLSDEEIERAKEARMPAVQSDPNFEYINEDKALEELRDEFNASIKREVGRLLRKATKVGVTYQEVIQRLSGHSKKMANIVVPLGDCRSREQIQRAIDSIPDAAKNIGPKIGVWDH